MKLFVLYKNSDGSDDMVIAISESKLEIQKYIMLKDFPAKDYYFIKVQDKEEINRIMFQYDALYLEFDKTLDVTLTRTELQLVDEIVDNEKSRIENLLYDLSYTARNYELTAEERALLQKAYNLIHKKRKKGAIRDTLKIGEFLGFLIRSRNISQVLKERTELAKEQFYIFINKD